MTAIGGLGHTLPYLIPHFMTATILSVIIVVDRARSDSWIRMLTWTPLSCARHFKWSSAVRWSSLPAY